MKLYRKKPVVNMNSAITKRAIDVGWRRCPLCGRLISYADMDSGRAKYEFVPDSAFTAERSQWEHISCQ